MLFGLIKHEHLLIFLGGMVAAVAGNSTLKSSKTRDLAVQGLAKGMKLQSDAQVAFQNMKEEAQDICYDAKMSTIQEDAAANTKE